jgi:hypothetical protein
MRWIAIEAISQGHAARQEQECHQTGPDRNQCRGGQWIEANLDQRVPACVAGSGKQNGEEYGIFHQRTKSIIRRKEGVSPAGSSTHRRSTCCDAKGTAILYRPFL